MKRAVLIFLSIIAIVLLLWGVDRAIAAPYPTGVGGTGTSAAPSAGQTLVGTASGTYTPSYLLCSGNCSIQSASGTVTISVPPQTSSTVTIYPVSVATNTFSVVGDGSFITVTNPATSTIKVSLSTAQVLALLSAASPLTYSSSTGQFSCASCLTSLNGALLVTNNLSDVASTTAARTNLGLGSIATYSKTDYLTSSTVYVSSVNGSSGAVTITSSTLGVISLSSFSASGTGLAYNPSTGVYTWTNPGYISTTTGNWAGTWQGVNSTTFYLASNPAGYTSTTIQQVLNSLSAAGCLTYSTSTGQFIANCLSTSTAAITYVPYTGATGNVNLGSYGLSDASETVSGNFNAQGFSSFGTSSLVYPLAVVYNTSTASQATAFLGNNASSGKVQLFEQGDQQSIFFGMFNSNFGVPSLRNLGLLGSSASEEIGTDVNAASGGSDPIIFSPGGYANEKARITTGGAFLLGATSPYSTGNVDYVVGATTSPTFTNNFNNVPLVIGINNTSTVTGPLIGFLLNTQGGGVAGGIGPVNGTGLCISDRDGTCMLSVSRSGVVVGRPVASYVVPTFSIGQTPIATNTVASVELYDVSNFNGNASGTWIGVNEATSDNADLVNLQKNGTSVFDIDHNGSVTIAGTSTLATTTATSLTVANTGTATTTVIEGTASSSVCNTMYTASGTAVYVDYKSSGQELISNVACQ